MNRRFLLQMAGAFALATAAGGAQAIPLTDLLAGQTIRAGDKLFDSWEVTFQDTSDGHSVNTDNIDVTALTDGGLDPGPGLQFDISNGEFDVTGDDLFAYTDFEFSFHVTVMDPNLQVKDVSLNQGSSFLSWTADGSNDNGSAIVEWVGTGAGMDDLVPYDSLSTQFSLLDGVQTNIGSDSADFLPQSDIWVTKDIFVWATDSTDSAGLSSFSQRFSQQTVPEPSTVLLMAAGIAGLGLRRKLRRA